MAAARAAQPELDGQEASIAGGGDGVSGELQQEEEYEDRGIGTDSRMYSKLDSQLSELDAQIQAVAAARIQAAVRGSLARARLVVQLEAALSSMVIRMARQDVEEALPPVAEVEEVEEGLPGCSARSSQGSQPDELANML